MTLFKYIYTNINRLTLEYPIKFIKIILIRKSLGYETILFKKLYRKYKKTFMEVVRRKLYECEGIIGTVYQKNNLKILFKIIY